MLLRKITLSNAVSNYISIILRFSAIDVVRIDLLIRTALKLHVNDNRLPKKEDIKLIEIKMPFNNLKTFDDLSIGKKSLIAHVTLLTFSVMDHFKMYGVVLKNYNKLFKKDAKEK